ncbi:MAG: glycosyltransferase family 4 protein [Acidobacteriota bacterium]
MRTYLWNLLRELSDVPDLRLTCFVSGALPQPDLSPKVQRQSVAGPWVNNWIWTEWQLPRSLSSKARRRTDGAGGIDLFHFPGYTLSSRMRCKKIVSVHDVSYAAHPEWYPHSSGRFRQRFYRRSAECADAVLTLSQFSKQEICRVYAVPPERVFIIHPASGLESVQPADRWERPAGVGEKYLLHVGDLHARRNLPTALEAFAAVRKTWDLHFVLIGRDLGARAEIGRHAATLGCESSVHFMENLPLDEMPHWYQNAQALVYPSLYEGFGLPLLEAMQWGCPVAAARVSSFPEVAGDAAWWFDPLSSREIAEGIEAILSQPHTRESLRERGFKRVKEFSWKKTAEETVAVYRQVLG